MLDEDLFLEVYFYGNKDGGIFPSEDLVDPRKQQSDSDPRGHLRDQGHQPLTNLVPNLEGVFQLLQLVTDHAQRQWVLINHQGLQIGLIKEGSQIIFLKKQQLERRSREMFLYLW